MLKLISSIISLALIILVIVFAISNHGTIELSMFPFSETYKMPLYIVVLLSIFFGFLWGTLIMSWSLLKATMKNKSLQNSVKKHIDY